jgi:uncharacterized protein YejL (UPF0352 family)
LSKATIIRTEATPEEIDAISQELANVLDSIEAPRGPAIISLISLAVQVMNPDITPHQLRDATLATSQYICALLAVDDSEIVDDATGEVTIDPKKLN